jgi:hypothetical protein
MKQLLLLITATVIATCTMAQAPDKMSYQAVVRNAANALVTNTTIGMRVSILQGSASGTAVYVETQTPTTNTNGLVSVDIGTGTVVSGTFSTIDWSAGAYYIKTEIAPGGGTSYTITGTSQLMSVPYALYAKTAGTTSIAAGSITNTHIAAAAGISYSKLTLTNSIQNADIVANAITTSKVANGTVTTSKMADSAISGLKLLTYAVTGRHLAAASVSMDKINATGTPSSSTYLRGDGTWSTVSSGSSAGLALDATNTSGSQTIAIGGSSVAPTTVSFNNNITYNSSYGTFNGSSFTVGTSGLYSFSVSLCGSLNASMFPVLYVNGNPVYYGTGGSNAFLPAPISRASIAATLNLATGDVVTVRASNVNTSTAQTLTSDGSTRLIIIKE